MSFRETPVAPSEPFLSSYWVVEVSYNEHGFPEQWIKQGPLQPNFANALRFADLERSRFIVVQTSWLKSEPYPKGLSTMSRWRLRRWGSDFQFQFGLPSINIEIS